MRIELTDQELRPIVQSIVSEVLANLESRGLRDSDRLAYNEAEAAALLGMAKHQLRDCRLRGQIQGSKPAKCYMYTRLELMRFLERSRA